MKRPIVLLRGFAAFEKDIEAAVSQVFLGYEQGSTQVRQDAEGSIQRSFFESVVTRLAKDEGYFDSFRLNAFGFDTPEPVPQSAIWTHRYYDLASETFGGGERLPMEQYALDLRRFLKRIRDKVCTTPAERADFKVHLVAHSMGGLVVRCYLQNICRIGSGQGGETDRELELIKPDDGEIDPWVDKVFTYGTPHDGIEFLGFNVPDLGALSGLQARNFNRKAIRDYMNLSPDDRANDLKGAFPADRMFCLVGTNWRDFDQPSKHVTREASDGLVMCANATAFDSTAVDPFKRNPPRAYVFRAHGGPLGMVNSEEGYQNLRRFLFGDWRVDVEAMIDQIRLPADVMSAADIGQTISANYRLDVTAAVRGEQVRLHERRSHTSSAVRYAVSHKKEAADQGVLPLLTPVDGQKTIASVFLMSKLSADTPENVPGPMEFALRLAIDKPAFEIDQVFLFKKHLEGLKVFENTFRFRINPKTGKITYGVTEQIGLGPPRRALEQEAGAPEGLDGYKGEIAFGPTADKLAPGQARGKLIVTVRRHH